MSTAMATFGVNYSDLGSYGQNISPDSSNSGGAYLVWPSGGVYGSNDYSVSWSYGRKSPAYGINEVYEYRINEFGHTDNNSVTGSYGIL